MGRGHKICPNCQCVNGVRSYNCKGGCGHVFKTKAGPERNILVAAEQRTAKPIIANTFPGIPAVPTRQRKLVINAPAEKCPIVFDGGHDDNEYVANWAKSIRSLGYQKGVYYTNSAILHFARQYFDINSSEYTNVKEAIDIYIADPYENLVEI